VNSFSGAIGVFDSGVGGLSVLKAMAAALPTSNLVYLADSANAPYGDRPEAFIQARVTAMANWLVERHISAIVVACNTATSVAVDGLRASVRIPVIAVEPPIKPACLVSTAGKVGVIATTRTIASHNVQRLIRDYAGDCQVYLQACPGLVAQVEAGDFATEHTLVLLRQYLEPLLANGIDTLVLGCTHYPFLREAILRITGDQVTIIEPAAAVARELGRRLSGSMSNSAIQAAGTVSFFSNTNLVHATRVMSKLWGGAIQVAAFDC
jgi:glutamate racemase